MRSAQLQSPSMLLDESGDNDSLKFHLFIKTQEMKQIAESLDQVVLLPKSDRIAWIEEHEVDINELLDLFMKDASMALDGLYLDREAMKLSMEFMTSLRDAMNTLQSMLAEHHPVKP